jgi:hypothetical protein
MFQSKLSSAVKFQDRQSLDESYGNEDAASTSLLKIWKSLDGKRKLKAGQIMTRPTVLPRGDDGDLIPDWAVQELQKQKEGSALLAVLDKERYDGEDQASDLEVALYLMCGSLEGPISEQAGRIYFHAASKISSSLKEAMESSGIDTGPLDEYDSAGLTRFKKWIRKQQLGAKNKAKIRKFIRTMDGTIIELKNFDLLCAEQQI